MCISQNLVPLVKRVHRMVHMVHHMYFNFFDVPRHIEIVYIMYQDKITKKQMIVHRSNKF